MIAGDRKPPFVFSPVGLKNLKQSLNFYDSAVLPSNGLSTENYGHVCHNLPLRSTSPLTVSKCNTREYRRLGPRTRICNKISGLRSC